jgi:predicted nucleotidyltransferase
MYEKPRFLTKANEISEIVREITKDKRVKAVYLFGSQVSGKAHKLSDIDICIITDKDIENVNYPITDNLDVSFFHLLPLAIQYRVLKEGKPLVIKDKEFIYNLKIKTLQKYLDIKPLINKYLMERFGCTI